MTFVPVPHDEPCEPYVSLLVRAADESLDANGRRRLDAHVIECAFCRTALEAQWTVRGLVAAAFDVDQPSSAFTTRVLAHLEPRESWLDRLDFQRWTWRVGPVAAGLVLAAWVVATGSTTSAASADISVVTSVDADATAVLLSDVVDRTDLVSLSWEADVAQAASEDLPQ